MILFYQEKERNGYYYLLIILLRKGNKGTEELGTFSTTAERQNSNRQVGSRAIVFSRLVKVPVREGAFIEHLLYASTAPSPL